MNIEQEIRAQIEKNKGLKLAVGEINNHLSILEGLLRNERDDVQKQVDEAYKKGYDKGYTDKTNNDEVGKELAKDVYQKGYNDGKEYGLDESDMRKAVSYQKGLDDAWEAAKKVVLNPDEGGLSVLEINEIFNCTTIQQVFRKYTLSEVIAKLKAYEEKQKADNCIEIGDEVKWGGNKCIVTNRHIDINMGIIQDYDLMSCEGSVVAHVKRCSFVKTGRHFGIDKILEEMRHD